MFTLSSRQIAALLLGCVFLPSSPLRADDPIFNYRSGVSLNYIGVQGEDYVEEYFYHDPKIWDSKAVYIRESTPITMSLNSFATSLGLIRYRVDRDLNYDVNWHSSQHHPTYLLPLRFMDLSYEDGTPVVGTVGPKPGIALNESTRSQYYWRGVLDSAGEEWHTITVANDISLLDPDPEYNATDGKMFLFIVNPNAPALSVHATGDAQFYTTPPKFYFLPRIHDQTTYILPRTGEVTIRLRDLYGENVHYRITREGQPLPDFVDALSKDVSLSSAAFADGTSVLEFYADPAFVRKRTIVKNPPFPSAGESHGNLLWGSSLYASFKKNITSDPTLSNWWKKLKAEPFHNSITPTFSITGSRSFPRAILASALIAHEEGIATKASTGRPYAEYAKDFMLQNLTRIDPIGLEQEQNGTSIPSREVKDRGYYTVGSQGRLLDLPFGYDLMISIFRSDQTPNGITPIEDFFIRDCMARWVMFTMTEIGGYTRSNPGMWGRSRFIASQVMALAMPSYSTPYFGTSGVNGNTTVYSNLPFPSKGYTWKEVFIDESNATPGYPDPKFRADFDSQWTSPNAAIPGTSLAIGQGAWDDRLAYSGQRLCGWPFGTLAMMSALHTGKTYPNFFVGIQRLKIGDLYGTKKLSNETNSAYGPVYGGYSFVDNSLYPVNTEQHVLWAKSNPSVFDDFFKYGSAYTLVWFDPNFKIPQSDDLELNVSTSITTKESSIEIEGTASNAKFVHGKVSGRGYRITLKPNGRPFRLVNGGGNWKFVVKNLQLGENTVAFRATGFDKTRLYRFVTITRNPE